MGHPRYTGRWRSTLGLELVMHNKSRIRFFSFSALILALSLMFFGASSHSSTPPARRPIQWGLYQILWRPRAYAQQIKDESAHFASKPHYIMFYRDLGRVYPKGPIDAIRSQNATAIVSLELWSWHGKRKTSYLPLIIEGNYDDFFRQWATDAKSHGQRILFRFGFEFNGDWFSWSLKPQDYVKAWKRVHHIFQDVGATKVEWVWSPNVVSCPNTDDNNMHLYYPGNEFVDWVGVDGYNFGEHHDQWHQWQSFDEVFGDTLKQFSDRYPSKPIILSEFGCAPGKPKQRSDWIHDAFDKINRNAQIKAAIWFNLDKRREGEPNWRIDVWPESLQAFNKTFAAPLSSDSTSTR